MEKTKRTWEVIKIPNEKRIIILSVSFSLSSYKKTTKQIMNKFCFISVFVKSSYSDTKYLRWHWIVSLSSSSIRFKFIILILYFYFFFLLFQVRKNSVFCFERQLQIVHFHFVSLFWFYFSQKNTFQNYVID